MKRRRVRPTEPVNGVLEGLFELMFLPVVGLMEAFVGFLWPGDAEIQRLQRIILRPVLLGSTACGLGAAVAVMVGWSGYSLVCVAVGGVCFEVAGTIGKRVEKSRNTDSH